MTKSLIFCLWLALVAVCLFTSLNCTADPVPGSAELPLQYLGTGLPDRWAPDGRLMYSPGVQNIQISRANRRYPPSFSCDTENHLGWTYQHHIDCGCWNAEAEQRLRQTIELAPQHR